MYKPNCQKFLSQSGLTFIILVSIKPGNCTETSDPKLFKHKNVKGLLNTSTS